MANQIHPRLVEIADAEAEAARVAALEAPIEQPSEPQPEAPSEPLATPAAESTEPAQPEPEDFWRISKTDAYSDLLRLRDENPEARNLINTIAGRQAKLEHQKRIHELEEAVAERDARLMRLNVQSMDEEALKERLFRDPEFRRQYDAGVPNVAALQERNAFTRAVDQAFAAVAPVLPAERLGQYENAMKSGWFDHHRDPQGRPVGQPLSAQESFALFQQSLFTEAQQVGAQRQAAALQAQQARTAAIAPAAVAPIAAQEAVPQPKSAPEPNLRLAQASPDMTSHSASPSSSIGIMPMAEYRQLSPPEKMRLFPEGLRDALRSGKVYAG